MHVCVFACVCVVQSTLNSLERPTVGYVCACVHVCVFACVCVVQSTLNSLERDSEKAATSIDQMLDSDR